MTWLKPEGRCAASDDRLDQARHPIGFVLQQGRRDAVNLPVRCGELEVPGAIVIERLSGPVELEPVHLEGELQLRERQVEEGCQGRGGDLEVRSVGKRQGQATDERVQHSLGFRPRLVT